MNLLLSLTLSCLLGLVLTQSCAPSFANDQILTGTYTFQLTGQRLQCYNTSLTTSTTAPLQLAYGIGNILNYQADTAGVDFSLRGRIEQQLLSFSLILNNASFAALTITYIITARPDILAGSYIADTNQLLECGSQQSALIAIPVPAANTLSSNSLAMLVFVNGMRTQAWLFNLKLQQPILDTNKGLLNVTVLTDSVYPIEMLFFSYLIIDLTKVSSSFTYAFTTAPQSGDFSLAGLVALTNSTSSQLQFAFVSLNKTNRLSCTGFTCSKCLSSSSCTSNGGVVSGTQCVKCGNNQIFLAGTGCVCASGYYMINGACGTCSSGSVYLPVSQTCLSCGRNASPSNNGACACNTGFYNISGSCQACTAGTVYSGLLLTCVSACSGGQQWTNGACSCPGKTYLISGSCGTCPVGYSYNTTTSSCSHICTLANQIYSNGQCLCAQGYTLLSGACTLTSSLSSGNCGANQYQLNGVCKCYPNFIQYQGVCYSCPGNSSVTADQSGCVCNQGYALTPSYTCAPVTYSASTSSQNTPSASSSSSSSSNQVASASSTTTYGSSTTSSSTPVASGTASSSSNTPSSSSSSNGASSGPSSGIPSSSGVSSTSGSSTSSGISSTGSTTLSTGSTSSGWSSSGMSSSSQYVSCPVGTYQDATNCQQCSAYCLSCFTATICTSCSSGFLLSQGTLTTTFTNACNEVCGDGRKFVLPCDDGNSISGDGCSSTCSVESGWTCSGGSANSKDSCVSAGPSSLITILQRVGIVNAVYQNVLVSSLPAAFTANGCPNCRYLLNATLVLAPPNSTIESNFIQGTQYQYVITAITPNSSNYMGTLIFTLQINSSFAGYFSAEDMAQRQVVAIDLTTITMYGIKPIGVTNSATGSQDSLEGDAVTAQGSDLTKALDYFSSNS